jgi:serine phosphatase RsbU (regulator of sigma subunit)
MTLDPDYQPEFDSLKGLLLDMAQERSWEALLDMIGNRLMERPHMRLGRIWLIRPGDICSTCPMRQECVDQTECLHLVASKGHPLSETGQPTQILDDEFKRIPLGVRKIGRIATQAESIAIKDMPTESRRESSREWAKQQDIHGVRGFPLIYKGEVLGVSMQFTHLVLESAGEGQVWGRIIADHIAAAIANARAFEELEKVTAEKERIESELKFAKLVQEGFLPQEPPNYAGYDFAAEMVPAKFVGGDFYDFIPLSNDQLGIVLGDVSGKGVSAALYMARLLSDFRYMAQFDPTPEKVLHHVNQILCERSQGGMFATAVFLLLDRTTRTLRIANAGHQWVFFKGSDDKIDMKGKNGGIPLGILPEAKYFTEELQLQKGDTVLLYTDGATEPFNEHKEPFGLKRLHQILEIGTHSPRELIGKTQKSIKAFTHQATPQDDLTLLAFKVL